MQRASQSFHSLAAVEIFDDTNRIAKLHNRQIGLTTQVRAPGKTPENYCSAVALRLTKPGQNVLEDIRRLTYPTFLQQSLTALGVSDVPLVRALRPTRILF